ncbi:hypothetical protein D915_002971 [Fasciola hepatica]|uniref:Uncharacterized protein n=1 Tax=Fasciola hepatica TaxID=6192 RepID=A0A4E0RGR8_FASHE|nr:hypothetical protein D915_002971 [Fasciola hepatica]
MKQTRLSLNTIVPEIGQLPITDMPVSNDFSHKSRFSVPQRYASLQYRNVYKEQSNYQNRSIFSFGMRRIGERKTDQSPASQTSCMARPSKLCIRPRFNNSRPSKQLSPLSEGHPTPSGVTFEDSANWSVNDLLKQEVSPAKKVQRLLRSEPDRTSFSARESPENSMVRLLDPECSSLDCGNPRYTTPEKFCTICRSDKTQAEDLPVPTVPRVLSQPSERKSSQDDWSGRCNGERRVSFALDQNKSLETTRNSDSPTRSGFCLGQLHGSGSKAISYNFPKRMEKMLENLKRTGLTGRLSPVSPTNEKKIEETTAPNEDNMEKSRSRFRPEEFECWRGQKQHVGSINPNDSTPKTGLPEGLTIETIGNGLPGQDGEYVTKAVNLDIANKATTETLSKTGDQNIQEVKVQTETKGKVSPVYFLHFLPRGPLFNRKQGGTDNKKSSKTQKKKLIPVMTPNQPPNSEAVANEMDKSRSSQTDPTKWCNDEQVRDIASPNSNTIEQHVADDGERFSTPPSTETLNSILEGTVTLAKQAVIQPVVQDHKKQTIDNAQMIFRPSISGPESSQLVRKSRERKHHHHKHPRESACSVSSKRSRRGHNDDVTCATATVPLDSIALEDWMNDLTENKANQNRLQKVFRLAKDVHELTKDDPHWKQFLYDQPRTNMDRDIDRVVDKLRRNALQLIELEQAFRMSKVQESERKRRSSHSKRRESLLCQRSLRRSHAQERVTQASSLLVKSPIEQGLVEDTLYEKISGGAVQTDQSLDYFPENLKSTAKSDFKAEQDTESRQCDEGELSPMHTRKQDKEEGTKQRKSVERENSPMPTSKIEQENISKPRKSTERDHSLMYTWNEEQKKESKQRKSVEREHVAISTNIAEQEDVSQPGKSVERGHSPLQAWTEEQQEESSKPEKSVEREHLPMQTLNKEQKDESKPRKSVAREHSLVPAFPVEQGEVSRARKSVAQSPIPMLNDEKQEGLKSRSPVKPGSFPVPIFDAKQRQDSNPIKSTEEMRSPTPAATAEQRGDSKHVARARSLKTSDAHSVAALVEDKLLSSKFSPRVLTPEKTSLNEDTKEITGIHSDVRNTELLEKNSTKIALKDNGNKVHVDSLNAGADPTNLMDRALATPTGKPNRRLSSCASMQRRSVAEAKLDTTSGKQSTYSGLTGQTELPWDKLSLPDMKHSANIYDLEQSPTCMKCESRPALLIAEAKSLPCSVNKNPQCGCGSSEPGPHVHEILPDQYCPIEKKAPMLNEPTTILPVKSSDGFRNDSSTNLAEQCIIPKEVPVDDAEFVSNKSPRKKNLTSITQKDKHSSVNQTMMNKSSGYLSPLSSREAKNPTTENINQRISTKRSEHTIDELQGKPTSLHQKDDFVNITSEFLESHTKDARNRTSTVMMPVATKVDEDNKTLDELPIRPSKADNVLNTPGVISNLSESSSPWQPNQSDIHDETPVANVQSDYRILVQPQTEGSEAMSAMEISPLQHELASIIKSGKYCEKDSDASPIGSLSHKTWKRGRNMPPECICAEGLSLPSTADNVFVASRSPSKSSVSLVGDKTSKLAESREMDSKQNMYSITRCESLEVHRGSTSQTDLDAEMRSGPHSSNSELSPKTKNSPVTTSPDKMNRSATKTKNERQRGIQSLPKIPEVQQEENREEDDDDEAKQSEAGTQRTSERGKENPTATLTIQFCLLGPNDAPNGSRDHRLTGEECGKSEPVNSLSYKLAVVPLTTELNKDLQREQFPISTLVHKYNEQREGKIDRPPSLVYLNENLRPEFQNQTDSLADHSTAMKTEANHPSGISSFSGSRGSYPLPTSHSQNPTEDEICCPNLFSSPSDSYQLSGKMVNIPGEMFSTRSSVPTSEQSRVSASASDKLRNTARAKPVTNAHQTPSLSSDPFQVTQSDYIEKENNVSTERPHNTDSGPVALSGTFDNDQKISDNIGSSLSEGQKDAIRTLRNSLDYVESSQYARKYFTSEENNLKQAPSTVNSGSRTSLNKTNMERPINHGEITSQVGSNSKRGSDHPSDLTNKQSVKSDNILLTRGESVPQNHERSRDSARLVLSNGSENPRVSVQQRKFSLPTIKEPHGLGKARTSDANSTDWRQSTATSHRKCLQLASSQNSPECYHSEKPQPTSGVDRVSIRSDSRQNSLPLIENQITDTSRTSLVQQGHSKSRQTGNKMHSEPDVHTSQLNGLIENESRTMLTSLPIVAEQPRASGSGSTIIISHSPLYSEDPSTRFDEVQRHSSKRSRRDGANQPIESSTITTPRASSGGVDGGAKGSRKSRKYRSSAKKSTILTVMVGERVNSELSVRESSPDEGSLPSTSSTTMLRSLAQHTPHERGLDSRLDGELLDCDQITDLRMHLQPEPIFQPARPVSISSRLSGTKQQTNPLKITVPGLNRLRDRPAGDLIEPSDTASLHKIVGNTEKPSRLLSISKISMSKHESEYTLEAENINFNPGTQSSDIKRIEVDLDSQANPTILIEQTRSTANEKHSIHQTEITTQFGRKYIANHSAQTFEDIEASKSRRSIQNQLGSSKPRSRNAKAQVVLSNGTSAELMLQYMASGMTKQMNRPLSPHETASVNQKKNSINWLGGLNQGILRKPVYSSQSEETQSGAQLGSPESFTSSCEASPSYSSSSQPRHETRICPDESPGDKSEEISVSICISDDSHSGFSRTTSSSRRDSSDSRSLDRRIYRTVRNFKRNVVCDNKMKHALCRRLQSNQLCRHPHSHHRHHQRETKHRRSHSRSIRPISIDSYCSGCTESDDSREVNSGENGRVIDLVSSTRPSRRCRSQCAVSPDFEKAFKLAPNVLRLFRLSSSLKDLSVHLIYRELRSMLLQRLLGKHEEEMDEISELVCRSHYI